MKSWNLFKTGLVFCLSLLITSVHGQYSVNLKQNGPVVASEPLRMGNPGASGKEINVNNLYMTIGGKVVLPVMGEFHFSRYDHRFWRDALLKMKSSGVNIVATYVMWIYHEEIEGRLDWTENNNIREFISLCDELGLLVHLRAGPYCNAETRNGGLPLWLRDKGAKPRTNDPLYLEYSRKWYRDLYQQVEGLLYKDGGPVMGLQIENEFVTEGLVISHMLNLKRIAVEEGFDVPVYSMTHWMAVDFPKGEIIPYAGYYIETPWINSGKNELPISNFQFFSYNRISDNIGTDIIKRSSDAESLIGGSNDSPYFTCEVGVGTPTFYSRRATVPEEMAGANINLRLGCGVNLMGYYMYVGGTNRVGEMTTLESSGGRVSYDYQAPLREFGNWGKVMKETKRYNYFMNDFGEKLAPAIAYLPTSNKDTSKLQWAVRLHQEDGFLFCSNYLYKHSRKEYQNVQFRIGLKNETLKIPRKPFAVKNGSYFAWPFNQTLGGVYLKYTTNQLICKHSKAGLETYFFFADHVLPSEYLVSDTGIKDMKIQGGTITREKKQYFVDHLTPGRDCILEITRNDGSIVRFITLTKEESHHIWKGKVKDNDFVAFSRSGLIYDDSGITVMDETPHQEIWVYESNGFITRESEKSGHYSLYRFSGNEDKLKAPVKKLLPMEGAFVIKPSSGKKVYKIFNGITLSSAENIRLRCKLNGTAECFFNDNPVSLSDKGNYREADVTRLFINGNNSLRFESREDFELIAEMEVLLKNGIRWTWQTDNTWVSEGTEPVVVVGLPGKNGIPEIEWNGDEQVSYFMINTPPLTGSYPEVRLNIGFSGDWASAYIGEKLVNDFLFDGSDWIFGINRYHDPLSTTPLLIRIKGFDTEDPPVYFEKGTDLTNCMTPVINHVNVKKEYRYHL